MEPNNLNIIAEGFEKIELLLKKALSTGRCFIYKKDEFSLKSHENSVA